MSTALQEGTGQKRCREQQAKADQARRPLEDKCSSAWLRAITGLNIHPNNRSIYLHLLYDGHFRLWVDVANPTAEFGYV